MKRKIGSPAPDFQVTDVLNRSIQLTSFLGKKVYLAFLRNTNCPLCSLHLFKLLKIIDRLGAKNMEAIIFYESSPDMFKHSSFFQNQILQKNNIRIISDPERKFYNLYGAERSAHKASLEVFQATPGRIALYQEAIQLGFKGDGTQEGTNADAIPADFLLDEKLTIRHVYYGNDVADHTPLSLVESFAINPNSI